MAVGNLVRGGVAAVAVGAGVLGVGVASNQDETTRDDSGVIVEEGGLGAFRIEVGDCLIWPSPAEGAAVGDATEIESVQGVPSAEEHEAEVYAAYDVDLPEYPGDYEMSEMSYQGCIDRFTAFVGSDFYTDETYDVSTLYPTSASWSGLDDREVICTVVRIDGAMMTGSAADTGGF